jgi:hypothetical protein
VAKVLAGGTALGSAGRLGGEVGHQHGAELEHEVGDEVRARELRRVRGVPLAVVGDAVGHPALDGRVDAPSAVQTT